MNEEQHMESVDDILKNVFNSESTDTTSEKSDPVSSQIDDEDDQPITIVDDSSVEDQLSSEPSQVLQEEEEQQREIKERKKASRLQREKYQLAEKNRVIEEEYHRIRQENEVLRNQQMTSSNASLLHYENSIKLQQANLKESLKKAYDMQDMEMVADINMELGRLGSEVSAVNSYKSQEALAQQQYQQQAYQQQYQQQQEPQQLQLNDETIEWANRNPWLVENNAEYDPEKVNEAGAFINYLDNYLARNGRHDEYQTQSYFDAIDQHMNTVFGHQNPPPRQQQQQLSMNRPQQHVAPVRRSGGGGSGYAAPTQVRLSTDEKDMARKLGVPLESFAKQKVADMKKMEKAREVGDLHTLARYGQIRI